MSRPEERCYKVRCSTDPNRAPAREPTRVELLRARAERALHPGYGYGSCYRCRRPWPCVEHHVTTYSDSSGCFPLCEGCWTLLETPAARLPYYRRLWHHWLDTDPDRLAQWAAIEDAVKAGL